LIGQALSGDEKAYHSLDLCSQSLISLCLPSLSTYRQKCDISSLQQLFRNAKYDGEGRFSRSSQYIKELDTTVLVQSLFLGSAKLEHRLHLLSMLAKSDFSSTAGAVSIIVAVFCEVLASRSTLIRSSVGERKVFNNVDCIIISMLVRSLANESDLEALEPVSHYVASTSLPLDVFKQVADVFALTPYGRSSILSRSQKTLHASNAPWWATIENGGSCERIESMQLALYGLCALLVEWDDLSLRTWSLLFDFLVIGKPPAAACIEKLDVWRSIGLCSPR
jgi:hypothetical protein